MTQHNDLDGRNAGEVIKQIAIDLLAGKRIEIIYCNGKGEKQSRSPKSRNKDNSQSQPEPQTESTVIPFAGEKPGFAPGSPEEEKYSPKTTLKPIPRNRPDVLVRNLLAHFPKEFVPNMIRATFQIFVEIGEKDQAKSLATEIYKSFGKK